MTTQLATRPVTPSVAELLVRLPRAATAWQIAAIADQLGAAGDPCAIRPLLARLGDRRVERDTGAEDSVCGALVALGVMRMYGPCSFALRPRHLLPADVVEMITELGSTVPMRYLIARQV
jgi:hypothetical protein